nr:MAG TPA: hypothetical protein [Caudoviricetes sp.]
MRFWRKKDTAPLQVGYAVGFCVVARFTENKYTFCKPEELTLCHKERSAMNS